MPKLISVNIVTFQDNYYEESRNSEIYDSDTPIIIRISHMTPVFFN